jgi:hypothetical protein
MCSNVLIENTLAGGAKTSERGAATFRARSA